MEHYLVKDRHAVLKSEIHVHVYKEFKVLNEKIFCEHVLEYVK